MKKITYFMSLVCMMFVASCASDTEEFQLDGRTVTVGVGLPGNDGSRVDFNNDLRKMVWNNGDRLTVLGYGADGKYSSFNMSDEMKTGANSDKATFSVKLNNAWSSCEFAYMGSKASVNAADKNNPYSMSFNNQVQNGAGNMSHLKDYILLKSQKYSLSQLSASQNTCMLAPAMSILKINVRNLPKDMMSAGQYTIKYYLNYDTPSQICTAAVTYNGSLTADGNNYVYIAFDPKAGKLSADSKIAFEIKAGTKTAVAYALAKSEKNYAAGKIYTATLDYNNTSNLTWVVTDTTEVLASALGKRSPVLLVLFSGQKCGNCPWTEDFRQREQDTYGADNYIFTVHHPNAGMSTFTNDVSLFNQESKAYSEKMELKDQGLPQPYFNALSLINRTRNVDDAFLGNDLLECSLNVESKTADTYQISVKTHLRSNRKDFVSGKNIDVILWTLEDNINARQRGDKGYSYMNHNHIFRGSLNGTWGVPYQVGSEYKGTFKLPAAVSVKANTDIVVLFVDHATKEIYDAHHFKIGVSNAAFK